MENIAATHQASIEAHDRQIEDLLAVAEKHSGQIADIVAAAGKNGVQIAQINEPLSKQSERIMANERETEALKKLWEDLTHQWQAYLTRLPRQ